MAIKTLIEFDEREVSYRVVIATSIDSITGKARKDSTMSYRFNRNAEIRAFPVDSDIYNDSEVQWRMPNYVQFIVQV